MKKTILILSALLCALSVPAQYFRLPVESSLSNPTVNCMTETDDGYIWIGTRRGLNRFNGSAYKVYYQSDSLSLSNDYIAAMCRDTDGRIWIGTSAGIGLMRNGEVDTSVNVRVGAISSMAVYDQDRLLVLIRNSLYVMDKNNQSMTLVWQDDSVVRGSVAVSENGSVWIHDLMSPRIFILDCNFSLFTMLESPSGGVNHILMDDSGICMTATDSGLYAYDQEGSPIGLSKDLADLTRGEDVLFITENKSGIKCIGLKDKGIYLFSGKGHDIHRVWEEESLSGLQYVEALLTDTNIFISKEREGIESCHFSSDKSVLKVAEAKDESLNMFYTFDDGRVLILTNKNAYMRKIGTEEAERIPIEGVGPKDWMTISLMDKDSCMWILNNGNELNKYSFEGKRFRRIMSISVEKTNSIWEGKNDEGIYLLQSNGILQILPDGTKRHNRMMKYPDFWFCGTTGSGMTYFLDNDAVWYFDEDNTISRMPIEVQSPECLYEDEDGLLWIGSQDSGIYVYDRETGKVEEINVSHGIPDNTTRSIVGDGKGNVWVSSRGEVYRISGENRDVTMYGNPEDMNFSYNTNSSSFTDNGYVFFGSKTHIAVFNTTNEDSVNDLTVRIDGLVIDGKAIEHLPENIELEHDGNVVSFYYSAMNYESGMRLSYRYRLEGYHDEWVEVGPATRINFSGLKAGRYCLVVAVQNYTGLWSENVLSCPFRVKPSPWMSYGAIMVYLIILAVIIFVLLKLIVKLRANHRMLEQAEHERLLNESLDKEKTDFFTNISHEYRTPLSLIYGPVRELIESNSFDEHDKYLLSLVARNTERMMGLTDQVLSYYSYDSKETLRVMKSDVSTFIMSMLQSFDYMFRQKELTLLIEVPEGLKAYCDREKVERILFNILSNAAKYTPEGGEITVRAGINDSSLVISVADTGVGISTEKMKSIFDRYNRGDMGSSSMPGFGIGLNYALHLTRLHKGMLSVSPNLPKGSIFTLSLPSTRLAYESSELILDTELSNENAILPDEAATDIHDYTVLVAEDNVELAGYIRHLLIKEYNVILAANGNEAIQCLTVSAPDIVISDVMMPFKDGYELCSEIKQSPEFCHLPVILLTAKADIDSQILGVDNGADAYLKKPFQPELLFATIRGVLENRKRLQSVLMKQVSDGSEEEEPVEVEMNPHDRIFIQKLHAMMEEHLSDEEFNVTAMAKEFGMSRTSLFSKMKALFGTSPQSWITDYRLNKAVEFLKTREFNISEVSYKVGFATLTGFSRSFKNKFGYPPSAV